MLEIADQGQLQAPGIHRLVPRKFKVRFPEALLPVAFVVDIRETEAARINLPVILIHLFKCHCIGQETERLLVIPFGARQMRVDRRMDIEHTDTYIRKAVSGHGLPPRKWYKT
jgi:hypothetical protein